MDQEDSSIDTYSSFVGQALLERGGLTDVVRAVKREHDHGAAESIAVFDERTGHRLDLDLRGSEADVLGRLAAHPLVTGTHAPRGRGRPRLGVVSREVSLLPRHWSWLGAQRGGASATLRRLVEAARKADAPDEAARRALDATHRFLWDIAGNLPGFEEVTRALFARDFEALERNLAGWPPDLRDQTLRMAEPARR